MLMLQLFQIFSLARKWNAYIFKLVPSVQKVEALCVSLGKKVEYPISSFFFWGTWGTNGGPMYFSLEKKVEYEILSFFSGELGEQMEGPCIFLLAKKWNAQFPAFFLGSKWRAHVFSHSKKSGVFMSKLFSPGRKMEPMSV